MKNLLLLAVIASFIFASCSEEPTRELNFDSSIGFKTFVGTTTKALDATVEDIKKDGVGINVYGWHKLTEGDVDGITNEFVPDYFNAVNVYYSETAGNDGNNIACWKYSPVKYWPADGKLNFIAIGNNVTISANSDFPEAGEYIFEASGDSAPTLKYKSAVEPTEQKDLLYAKSLNKMKTNPIKSVQFIFKHILSKIDVEVKADSDDENLMLKIFSIKFTGIKHEGTIDLTDYSWQTDDATVNVVSLGLVDNFTQIVNKEGNSFEDPQKENGGLIIIPQKMNNIEVEYQFLQKDTEGNYTQVIADCTGDDRKVIELEDSSWELGKKYRYNFIFKFDPDDPNNPGHNSTICFSVASITDWEIVDHIEENIPVGDETGDDEEDD